jgi:alpha-galactosidase
MQHCTLQRSRLCWPCRSRCKVSHGCRSRYCECVACYQLAAPSNYCLDYLKEDSCCGSQDHNTAFSDYSEMRDALNKTGRPVYFSLCGWHTWYAPQGDTLGNSWRIAGDGTNWGALSNCMNDNAPLQQYARPGAWNDPDLLQGTGKGSNDKATNPSGCYVPSTMPQTKDWYQTIPQVS